MYFLPSHGQMFLQGIFLDTLHKRARFVVDQPNAYVSDFGKRPELDNWTLQEIGSPISMTGILCQNNNHVSNYLRRAPWHLLTLILIYIIYSLDFRIAVRSGSLTAQALQYYSHIYPHITAHFTRPSLPYRHTAPSPTSCLNETHSPYI